MIISLGSIQSTVTSEKTPPYGCCPSLAVRVNDIQIQQNAQLSVSSLDGRAISDLTTAGIDTALNTVLDNLQLSLDGDQLHRLERLLGQIFCLAFLKGNAIKLTLSTWKRLLPLTVSPSLPISIRTLLERITEKITHFDIGPLESNLRAKGNPSLISRDTKRLAIEVANLIEGHEFRDEGIRVRVHRELESASRYVMAHLKEFELGRRNFVFVESNSPVPMQNYKDVMLYILRCLKEDRKEYFRLNPHSFDENIFAEIEKAGRDYVFGTDEKGWKLKFEFYVRKLLTLEEEVIRATSDQQIQDVMQKFKEIYYHIPNHISPSIATGISHVVFNSNNIKPIHSHTPQMLINLAARLGKLDNTFNLTSPLFKLVESATSFSQESFQAVQSLKSLYQHYHSINDEEEKMILLRKMLALAAKEPLLEEQKKALEGIFGLPQPFWNSLGRLISTHIPQRQKLIIYFTCDGDEKDKFSEPPTQAQKLRKEFSPYFFYFIYDCEATAQRAAELRKKYDQLDTKEKHPAIQKVLDQIDPFLDQNKRRASIPEVMGRQDLWKFAELESQVKQIHTIRPEFSRKAQKLTALVREFCADPKNAEAVLKECLQLKQYIIAEVLPDLQEDEVDLLKEVWGALNMIERKACSALTQLPDALLLQPMGLPTPLSLEEMIAHRNRQMGSFVEVMPSLINDEQTLSWIGMDPTAWHAMVMRDLARPIDLALDTILGNLSAESPGRATQAGKVVGTLKIMEDGQRDFKPGNILVFRYVPSDIHLYKGCAAIIAEEGGIYSHAAILARECHLPAWIGVDGAVQRFRKYEGQRIVLHLDPKIGKSSLSPSTEEVAIAPPAPRMPAPHNPLSSKGQNLVTLQTLLQGSDYYVPPFEIIPADNLDPKQVYQKLKERIGRVPMILRSSASEEDQANHSAAGIFISVPNIESEQQFLDAVERVKNSAASALAQSYTSKPISMGMILQRYEKETTFSGVAFSQANAQNPRLVGIQFLQGLGGAVDSAKTPSFALVDPSNRSLKELTLKQLPLVMPLDAIRNLATCLKNLESNIGCPVEVEFAGKAIVQMRPIV